MEQVNQILQMFGADAQSILAVATVVYLSISVLRAKLPPGWTEGGKSTALALVLAVLAALNLVPFTAGAGFVYAKSLAMTAFFGWVVSFFVHEKFKGTSMEIKRGAGRVLPGEKK